MPIRASTASEDRIARLVLRSATDLAIVTTDLEGTITSWNPGAEKLLGWPAAEILGQRLGTLFTLEEQARGVPHERLRAARTEEGAEEERWYVRKDGARVRASGRMTRLEDETSGEHVGYLELLRAGPERPGARGEHERDSQFRALVEVSPQVVWFGDAHGRITYCNPYWEAYTGLRAEGTAGEGWASVIHPDHQQRVLGIWKHAVETQGRYEVEIPFRRAADGTYRWFLARGIPIRNDRGGVERWVGIAVDIDDRRRAEEALRASEERFRSVADATPGFIWTADTRGMLDYTSPRWHEYSGTTPDDSTGTGWASFVHPEDQQRALGTWAVSVASGQFYETEFRLRARDGRYRWWLARALPMDTQGESAGRWAGVCMDIHEIVAARETLSRSREQLETLVAERTADRDRMWRLSTDVMLVADFHATIVAVNPAWTKLFGWSEAELLGQDFMQLRASGRSGVHAGRGGPPGARGHHAAVQQPLSAKGWRLPAAVLDRGAGRELHPRRGPRHHRGEGSGGGARAGAGGAAAGAEDGGGGPAHRRHRARLQQPAHGHHRARST